MSRVLFFYKLSITVFEISFVDVCRIDLATIVEIISVLIIQTLRLGIVLYVLTGIDKMFLCAEEGVHCFPPAIINYSESVFHQLVIVK